MPLADYATRFLRFLMVFIIALMTVLVVLNVVLRYGFNSSLGVTEELARYLFVWLTFLGAISAFIRNTHVRVDSILVRLPVKLQRTLTVLSDLAMFVCCAMITISCWKLTRLNMTNYLPISEIPVGALYFAGVPFGACVGGLLILRISRAFCSCRRTPT